MRHPRRSSSTRTGFVFVDAVMGLGILAVLAGALTVALNRRHHAADRIGDTRGAVWAAELALAKMQAGQTPGAGEEVTVEVLPGGDTAKAPAGYTWVRVRGERNGRPATLIGLVPATVAAAATTPSSEGGRP